ALTWKRWASTATVHARSYSCRIVRATAAPTDSGCDSLKAVKNTATHDANAPRGSSQDSRQHASRIAAASKSQFARAAAMRASVKECSARRGEFEQQPLEQHRLGLIAWRRKTRPERRHHSRQILISVHTTGPPATCTALT